MYTLINLCLFDAHLSDLYNPIKCDSAAGIRFAVRQAEFHLSVEPAFMSEVRSEPRALRILVIEDNESIRLSIAKCLEAEGDSVRAVATIDKAFEETTRLAFDLIFVGLNNGLDHIPRLLLENAWARVIMVVSEATDESALRALKLGASDYISKPIDSAQLRHITRKVAERRRLERTVDSLQKALDAADLLADLPTSNAKLRESVELARQVANSNVAVLIRGEIGTGKRRLARAIHEWSRRSRSPFASIAFQNADDDAAEAELFGGAAGDANSVGAVAFCQGGTLLLDEVSQVPMRLQPRVLSLLKEQEFESQDGTKRRPGDVRIIATTQTDLQTAIAAGRFREDLFMALSVIQIDLPPLRDRGDDVLTLADRYLTHFGRIHHRPAAGFSRDATFVLKTHTWPGNISELRNVIERAVLECSSETIGIEHLPPNLLTVSSAPPDIPGIPAGGHAVGDLVALEVIEAEHIRKVLASVRTLRRAATVLGINASTLYRKLRRLESATGQDKTAV